MSTVNPTNVNVTDANVVAEGVTDFKLLAGLTTGGPYSTSSADVKVSQMTNNGGVYSAAMTALTWNPPLSSFTTYFIVAQAVNPAGASGNSPEASFSLEALPSAPTALSFT